MLIRFVIYGLLGWCVEIVWTASREKITGVQGDWKLRGTTYLWMFFIYGGAMAFLFEPVHNALRPLAWPVRGLVYVVGIFAVEYGAGWLLRRTTGACPWDYTGRSRWQVNGLIRLDYAPAWFVFGLVAEQVHDFLVVLTPAIQAALGLGS
jgi:uncharacterized membrane protein